jgi:serine O-acetyltransferase
MTEKISIVTISYNSEKTIEKTLQSVLSQSYRPLEYVLVDGSSTDGTVDLIRSYIPRFEAVGIETSFKSEPDTGISDAFNKGIKRASGDIIGITNADDAILPDMLAYVAENFPQNVDVFYGNILWEDADKGISYVRKSSANLCDLKFQLKALHPAVYIRKTTYKKYGYYDTNFRYCMDKELLARIQRMGGTFQYADITLVSVAAGGVSDNNVGGVAEEGEKIAIANGVSPIEARRYFKKKIIKVRILGIIKKIPGFMLLLTRIKGMNDKKILIEKCKRKPYLYDLYRWTGKVDIKSWLHWMFISKYRTTYFFRKCEQHKGKHRIRFCFYRLVYGHYAIKYGVDLGTSTKIGPGFIIRHTGGIAINGGAVIGKDVEILQGVTIGYARRGKRQGNPIIGDRVWIGSHATIVGNITVGNDVLIAPGAFVNFDVPDNSIVIGNPGRIVKKDNAVEGYVVNILDEVQ